MKKNNILVPFQVEKEESVRESGMIYYIRGSIEESLDGISSVPFPDLESRTGVVAARLVHRGTSPRDWDVLYLDRAITSRESQGRGLSQRLLERALGDYPEVERVVVGCLSGDNWRLHQKVGMDAMPASKILNRLGWTLQEIDYDFTGYPALIARNPLW